MNIGKQMKELKISALYAYESARSWTFTIQSLSLPFLEFLVTGKSKTMRKSYFKHFKKAQRDLHSLLRRDAVNISDGIYPMEVLKPEPLKRFSLRYPKILLDGAKLARRRLSHSAKEFDVEAAEYLRDVPEYFQRNFHFQTGGYLTESSAELYEHQVEILFAGAADAMRRLILRPMKEQFPFTQGEGLHFLEVAAGTGRLTRFVKLAFPKAKITVLDLSHPYLKKAQDRLNEFRKLDFVQGDAADLPFGDQKFDAVISCFMFHELPLEIRKKAVQEALRVLKPGGYLGMVDALQNGDKSDFKSALQQFPLDFHEPFFKNYLQNPMEGLFEHAGFTKIHSDSGFLAKALWGEKPTLTPHFS